MDWKSWETINRTEGAVAAFTCTAGGPPPKTAPGHGLPQTRRLENLGNIQENRGCGGGLHLPSRGSSSKDCSRTWSPSDTQIREPGKHSREQRVRWRPSSAQQGVLLQRLLQDMTRRLENLGNIQENRGCGGGLHLPSRGSSSKDCSRTWSPSDTQIREPGKHSREQRVRWRPSSAQQGVLLQKVLQDMVSLRQIHWKTWETINTEGAVAAFTCTAGGPPPQTAPGHGLPQNKWIGKYGIHLIEQRVPWQPSSAQQGFLLHRQLQDMCPEHHSSNVSQHLPKSPSEKLFSKKLTLGLRKGGCSGGLHLHSRGSSSKDSSTTWSPSDT
ncbi:uncharacterized protein LOC127542558 isoform X2 [Antechinus flavipes]|uniref:uncharacterized protein LOC127542558 isoform X2 n=1 Tax=Antechinus flavipes TaxID=38775 RepID=UPI0022363363|nr:uncharacterized protein LOC127542558 isoform X2 [Antechinus flavipes]